MYKDAMETASLSGDRDIAEGLLDYFVQNDLKHCFAACLYTCYELVHPDFAMELAWKSNLVDFAFPFILQFLREYTMKVDTLIESEKKQSAKPEQPTSPVPVVQGVQPGVPFGYAPGVALPGSGLIPILPMGGGGPMGAFVPPPGAIVSATGSSVVVPPGLAPPGGYPPEFGYY